MSKTTKAPALKACPWCGGIPFPKELPMLANMKREWAMMCQDRTCPLSGKIVEPSLYMLGLTWNTRKGEP